MDRDYKMFLYDYGTIVVRLNSSDEIVFFGLAEFQRYAHDLVTTELDGKSYVCYMPEAGAQTYVDEQLNIQEWQGPIAFYDNILAAYGTLKERKLDRTYGLTGQELIDMQEQIAFEEAEQARADLILDEIKVDNFVRLTPAEIDAHLDTVYDHVDFDAATDFASLKTAIGQIFNRQKALDRKMALRIQRILEPR